MKTFNNASLLISNGKVCTPTKVIENGCILIEGEKIIYVGSEKINNEKNCKKIDAKAGFICPGFIDLHVNGGGGKDITAGTDEAIYGIAKGHATGGTTGLLLAVTGPTEEIAIKGLKGAAKISRLKTRGSKILGVHMEGPFVNPKRQGPVFRNYPNVSIAKVDKIKKFIDVSNDSLKIITLAPELEGAIKVIEYLVSEKINPSVGHTEATYEEVIKAIEAGVNYAAHIFNAMPPIHHRQPGAAGALITSSNNVIIELVADGYHVHPGAIKLLLKAKGLEQIVLVTDATEVVGTNLTSFTLPIGDGLTVKVKDGRTWGPEGQLIGSVLQMNHAIRNMKKWFDIPLHEIVLSATLQPAKVIGIENITGSLEVGKLADVAVLDPNFEVIATIVNGEIVYSG